jgi:hypothetical protein
MKNYREKLIEAFNEYVKECSDTDDAYMFISFNKEDHTMQIESKNTSGLYPLFANDPETDDENAEKINFFKSQLTALILLSLTTNKELREYFKRTIAMVDMIDEFKNTLKGEDSGEDKTKNNLKKLN